MVDYEDLARRLKHWLLSHNKYLGSVEGPLSSNIFSGFESLSEEEIIVREDANAIGDIGPHCVTAMDIQCLLEKLLVINNYGVYFAVRVFPKFAREEINIHEVGNPANSFRMLGNQRLYFRIYLYKPKQEEG